MRKVESNMTVDPLIQSLKGKLVVSVQAYMGEPLRTPETMAQMSRACELGGAAAIRCQGLADIAAIKGRCEVPVIGLWKDGHEASTSRRRCVMLAPALLRVSTSWQLMPLIARVLMARPSRTPSVRCTRRVCS